MADHDQALLGSADTADDRHPSSTSKGNLVSKDGMPYLIRLPAVVDCVAWESLPTDVDISFQPCVRYRGVAIACETWLDAAALLQAIRREERGPSPSLRTVKGHASSPTRGDSNGAPEYSAVAQDAAES